MKRVKNPNTRRKNILTGVECYEGESLIESLEKKLQNREQVPVIMDTAYTEKSVGVLEAYNIRTDRFEVGQREAERIGKYKMAKKKKMTGGGDPGKAIENSNNDE